MARNIQPIVKRCRALGISPATMGYTGVSKRDSIRDPGAQKRRKKSEYALQLNEKQKVKFVYGVLEKQFHSYYEKATRMPGKTGENLLKILESRLDNVVFNLGFAMTRPEARQLVRHGHFTVNGKKVNIPSYLCRAGDVIAVKEGSRSSEKFKAIMEANAANPIPKWLDVDRNTQTGRIINLPEREDIDLPVEEHLIVELYSK
ncbi:MAG: 30S ribosomal protein S4 [Firmicutes bacterium]|jgi:small subunit ribosomal protein S4|nr:30S ribosomal protein S4 [Bacillota bacterium]